MPHIHNVTAPSDLPEIRIDSAGRNPPAIECDVRPPDPKPLRIAFALGGTDLGRSGIGRYVREILRVLAPLAKSHGGSLEVFGHERELSAYSDVLVGANPIVAPWIPMRPGPNALWHFACAGTFARRTGAEVLLLPAANRRISMIGRLPTVAVVHDLAQFSVPGKYDPARMAYFRHLLIPALRRPTRIVAVSHATRTDLESVLGPSSDRLRVVHNGVDTARFTPTDPESDKVIRARTAAGLEGKPYLLYPSRLEHPGKNHIRLLRAFSKSGLGSTHRLAFAGPDWGAGPLLRETIRRLRLERSVALLGYVPDEDLPALYAGADAALVLGLHEGFGLPALEALSAGRPVCVSETGSLPEVVGALGVQCDPTDENSIANGLVRILRDDAIRSGCSRLGPKWAQRFSWSRTADRLLDVCREAAHRGEAATQGRLGSPVRSPCPPETLC